jgi:multidrug efflux system membrane fusion protein
MESADLQDQNPKKGSRVFVWLAVIAVVGVGCLFLYEHMFTQHAAATNAYTDNPPAPVATTVARKGDIGVYVEPLGIVTPVNTVSVVSRVQGEIMKVNYTEGQMVHRGDSLLVIDPRPYEAQLSQVQGQLAHDQATLNEARIDLERYMAAYSKNAIAKQQVDDQQQAVLQDEGTVKNDEGQVANVQLNLVYCNINSPIDGRVGLRLVDTGNLVQANSTNPLVVITQLQPITVIFSVAEDYLPQIQQQLRKGQRLAVDAFDRAQSTKIAEGALQSLDNQIDTSTGTVKLRAVFANQDSSLFPNQFVNARLLVDTERGTTLLPTAAIQRNGQGAFVYVVNSDKASVRPVKISTTDGTTASVQGVQPNEVVVINGFDKLQDGVKVSVRNPSATADAGAAGAAPGTSSSGAAGQ